MTCKGKARGRWKSSIQDQHSNIHMDDQYSFIMVLWSFILLKVRVNKQWASFIPPTRTEWKHKSSWTFFLVFYFQSQNCSREGIDEKWGRLWRLACCRRRESDDGTRQNLRQHISSAAASIVWRDACASMDWFLTSSLLPPRSYCFPYTSGAFYDLIFFFQAVPCLFYGTAVFLLGTKTPPAYLSTCLSPFATPWGFFRSLAASCCATKNLHFCSQVASLLTSW